MAWNKQYDGFLQAGSLLLALPLLGALVGAPLVAREVEQRTHLLVWTQSITHRRWLTVKLALVLGAGLLASGAQLAVLIWWYRPWAQLPKFGPKDGGIDSGSAAQRRKTGYNQRAGS